MESSNDFSKFLLFVKGVLESGWVIKRSGKKLNNEAKMHFNRLLNEATQFEKYIHKEVGPEIASLEDDINSDIIHFVWTLFDLPAKERDEFFEYINKFENRTGSINNPKNCQSCGTETQMGMPYCENCHNEIIGMS